MYKVVRNLHKWAGLAACLFLMVISGSGFFLAIKGRVDWMRPKTQAGTTFTDASELMAVEHVMDAALGAGYAELRSTGDIDRMEFHAEDRIWKVLSKEGYREVQVDAVSGKVLSKGQRNDQMFEDIHDFSYFAKAWHEWGLPVVAFLLFWLSFSGVIIFFVPVWRRWAFQRARRLPESS